MSFIRGLRQACGTWGVSSLDLLGGLFIYLIATETSPQLLKLGLNGNG